MSREGEYIVSDEGRIQEVSCELGEMLYVRAPIYIHIRQRGASLEK